jgi:hypothetical protein
MTPLTAGQQADDSRGFTMLADIQHNGIIGPFHRPILRQAAAADEGEHFARHSVAA